MADISRGQCGSEGSQRTRHQLAQDLGDALGNREDRFLIGGYILPHRKESVYYEQIGQHFHGNHCTRP